MAIPERQRVLQEIILPNNDRLLVAAVVLQRDREVALAALPIEKWMSSIRSLSQALHEAMKAAAPTKATIEFGVEAGLNKEGLIALLAGGAATANIKVTLEWSSEEKIAQKTAQ